MIGFVINEQKEIFSKYSIENTKKEFVFNFFKDFLNLLNLQRKTKIKVFLKDIKYYEKYKMDLLEIVVEIFSTNINIYMKNTNNDINNNIKNNFMFIENFLIKLRKLNLSLNHIPDFNLFYKENIKIFYKGINIGLDKIENIIFKKNKINILNNLNEIKILFKYTIYNIDFYKYFINKIISNVNLIEEIEEEINELNKNIIISSEELTNNSINNVLLNDNTINNSINNLLLNDSINNSINNLLLNDSINNDVLLKDDNISDSLNNCLQSTKNIKYQTIYSYNYIIGKGFELIENNTGFNHKFIIYDNSKTNLITVNLNENILGKKRILKYSMQMLINKAAIELTLRKYSTNEDGYIRIMDFTGEISKYITKYSGIENTISCLKEYARFLLVDK